MVSVSVLIPAYNEEQRVGKTITSLWSTGKVQEIIVIDDGSTDYTGAVAAKYGARVIRLVQNQGKGKALTVGFSFQQGEFVLLVDADLQESAGETLKLLDPILKNQADLAVALFTPEKSGKGFGLARQTAQAGIKYLTGAMSKSPLSGQRAAKQKVWADLLPFSDGFGMEVGMYIDALQKGYRVMEIPLDLAHCPPGRNWAGFWHRGRQFYHICKTLMARAKNKSSKL